GVIYSTFNHNAFKSGSILLLTNDDFSFDLNNDGSFQKNEMRNAQNNILSNNTFRNNQDASVIIVMGRNNLVKNNRVENIYNDPTFVEINAKCSGKLAQKGLFYENYNNKIIGNIVNKTTRFSKWSAIEGIVAGRCID